MLARTKLRRGFSADDAESAVEVRQGSEPKVIGHLCDVRPRGHKLTSGLCDACLVHVLGQSQSGMMLEELAKFMGTDACVAGYLIQAEGPPQLSCNKSPCSLDRFRLALALG